MREIKFRGMDFNKWVYGDLVHNSRKEPTWIMPFGDTPKFILVIEKSIGQYTGLKDKNGKEIYEGDIVHYKSEIKQWDDFLIHEQVGEIKIDKGMTGFKGKTKQIFKDEINIHDSKFLFLSSDIYEVIGNIYENPELMEMKGNEENISTQARV